MELRQLQDKLIAQCMRLTRTLNSDIFSFTVRCVCLRDVSVMCVAFHFKEICHL